MTADLKKTLELIRKLFAKSDSAAQLGSSEEAAAFASKANELLLRHKLELSEVDALVEEADDPIENDYADISEALGLKAGKREPWLTSLFAAVARAHFCVALYVPGSKRVRLVGRRSDREIALYMVTVLAQTARRLAADFAEQEKRAFLGEYGNAGYWRRQDTMRTKAAFLVGFAIAVKDRLKALRQEVEQQGGQFALVRFAKADDAAKRAAAPFSTKGSNNMSYRNESAFAAGQQAGQSVSLHGGVQSGRGGNGTLARGQRLLGGSK